MADSGTSGVKLPLAARKSIRDKWDAKRPEREAKLSEIMGTPWTIPVDYATVWPYLDCADNDMPKGNPGGLIDEIIRSFLNQLDYFKGKHGPEGIQEMNKFAKSHSVIIAHTEDESIRYGSTDIDLATGVFRILARTGKFHVNVNDFANNIAGTLNKASMAAAAQDNGGVAPAIGFEAQADIRKYWDTKLPELQKDFQTLLNLPSIKLTPNFEANAAKLLAYEKSGKSGLRDDWQNRIGWATYEYFSNAHYTLKNKGFGKDDMLQEGFAESVDKNEITLRVVDSPLPGGKNYNTAVIEGGVLVMLTVPESWTSNVTDTVVNLIDLL